MTVETMAATPKTATFQFREVLPFVVAPRSKAAEFEQAVGRLMSEIDDGAKSAMRGGWFDEAEIMSEFGVRA